MRLQLGGGAALAALVLGTALPAAAATATPNDPLFVQGDQWGLSGAAASINAPQAWPVSTGAGVLVADVDTGANFGHPDLAGKLVAGARFTHDNCTNQNAPYAPSATGQSAVTDDVDHGSMTTGLMVADTNNGTGIAAVAPSAWALIIKVLSATRDINGNVTGSGCDNDVAAGIYWAADHGAQVINLSIGSDVPGLGLSTTSEIPAAVRYAAGHGVAVALAAGNGAGTPAGNAGLPASDYIQLEGIALVVGALAPDDTVPGYSNSLAGVNVYAPGGDSTEGNDVHHLVISTGLGSSYIAEQGTSFAAPHVAGTLALLMSCGLTGAQARQRILDTRRGGTDLDAAAAVSGVGHCAAAATPTAAPGVTPGQTARPATAPPATAPPGAAPGGAPVRVRPGGPPIAAASQSPGAVAQAPGSPGPSAGVDAASAGGGGAAPGAVAAGGSGGHLGAVLAGIGGAVAILIAAVVAGPLRSWRRPL